MQLPNTADETPLISIIMPNYNGVRWLEHSIGSVMDQTYLNWELIVVDDGSTDDSGEVIRGFAARDGRISPLVLADNSGNPGVARNAALDKARGKYVAFIDSDDLWRPEKLSKQVALMETLGREIVLCYHDMAISVIGGGYLDRTNYSQSRMRRPVEGSCFETLLVRNFIPTSSVMLRRDVLLENQFLFSSNHNICQDWALWLRIVWQYDIVHIPEVLGTYRLHGGNVTSNRKRLRKEEKAVIKEWRGIAPTGVYTKAIAVRYLYFLYDLLPLQIRVAINRALPWPR